MHEHIVKHKLLDLEIDDNIAIELTFQQPSKRFQVWDIIANLSFTPCCPSASSRHRFELKSRNRKFVDIARPSRPRLKRTIIYNYWNGGWLQTFYIYFINWIRCGFVILKSEYIGWHSRFHDQMKECVTAKHHRVEFYLDEIWRFRYCAHSTCQWWVRKIGCALFFFQDCKS